MESGELIITNKNSIVPKHKNEHEPYEYYKYEVTERSKANKCYVCIFEIPPHKAGYPYHYHLISEEVFYIISGEGILETPDGEKSIRPGDVIVCPPSEKGAHRIINPSNTEMLVYLDCSTVASPDIAYYPNTGKVGVITVDGPNTFFKTKDNVPYYEGE